MRHDFTKAHHLPKLRGSKEQADPYDLPRQRSGKTPQMHGRYPDYDVLEQAGAWDEPTRAVVFARVDDVPEREFFTAAEAATLGLFCDDLLAQDSEPRIPVLAFVDAKHAAGKTEGYRYADMPPDSETWRLVARGLDEAAGGGAGAYADTDSEARERILDAFSSGDLEGGVWAELDVSRAWSVVTRDALSAFYAHPWAWNEIGFGGPAYPRGYARMGVGVSEAWEGEEAIHPDPVPDVKRKGLE
jgi:gluconate 2-dehydrogenase subunit 3-like protein